jgi:hypothetical protein
MFKKVLTERQLKLMCPLRKYGTPAGAMAAWDTRGRGQKEEPKEERRGKQVAVGTITKPDGTKILINVDGNKMRVYIDTVQSMKDVADAIGDATTDVDATSRIGKLQIELSKLDSKREELHDLAVIDSTRRVLKQDPKLNPEVVHDRVREAIASMADKIVGHMK